LLDGGVRGWQRRRVHRSRNDAEIAAVTPPARGLRSRADERLAAAAPPDFRRAQPGDWSDGGTMRRLVRWLLRPLVRFMDGFYVSGADSCEYLGRLAAVPASEARERRRAA